MSAIARSLGLVARRRVDAVREPTYTELLRQTIDALTQRVEEENADGGRARATVYQIGRLVDVDLGRDVLDGVWGDANMGRVVVAVKALVQENRKLKGLPHAFH